MNRKQRKMLARLLSGLVLAVVLWLLPTEGMLRACLFLIPYLLFGYDVLLGAVRGVIHLRPFDEEFLMAVASVGAMAVGEWIEGLAVMALYQIGELFSSIAVSGSRRSIASLMDIRPDMARRVLEDGGTEEVAPEEIELGERILVRPGERIPLDGIVTEGGSSLDTASLTGESLPREVGPGAEVISGCINLSGVLTVRTTKRAEESTVARILDLVENASSKKSKSEHFISKFARIYTPVVCIAALALALVPPLVLSLMSREPAFAMWIHRALTLLVISCPCALVISVPLTFFSALGGASREGILIKGSNYMETLGDVRTVVFDKTGTLTEGQFSVEELLPVGVEGEKLLEYAALAEGQSTHPIAKSLVKAYGGALDPTRVGAVTEQSGEGLIATVDGCAIAVGNEKLMARVGAEVRPMRGIGSVVYIARDGVFLGGIRLCDRIKEGAPGAIEALKACGVEKTVMLSGDRREIAEAVASELSIDEVRAELLPHEKVAAVEELLRSSQKGHRLAYVGDGINDAPVLARADIGIAMGALGSEAAIEAADVVLPDDDPRRIARAIKLARRCMAIVRQNIFFALGVKLACLLLGAVGIANMWVAVFADVGVMILCVLNAVRALGRKKEGRA